MPFYCPAKWWRKKGVCLLLRRTPMIGSTTSRPSQSSSLNQLRHQLGLSLQKTQWTVGRMVGPCRRCTASAPSRIRSLTAPPPPTSNSKSDGIDVDQDGKDESSHHRARSALASNGLGFIRKQHHNQPSTTSTRQDGYHKLIACAMESRLCEAPRVAEGSPPQLDTFKGVEGDR